MEMEIAVVAGVAPASIQGIAADTAASTERGDSEISASAVVAVQDPLSPADSAHVTWFAPKELR
jgi:hypothetical protein